MNTVIHIDCHRRLRSHTAIASCWRGIALPFFLRYLVLYCYSHCLDVFAKGEESKLKLKTGASLRHGIRSVTVFAFIVLMLIATARQGPAQVLPPQAQPAVSGQGSASRGEALFIGNARFHDGGPACASCHSIAGLPFPNGGTLGPNLTREYSRLGAQGLQLATKTLYFPVMTSIYDRHPLTPEEQSDLLAFFQEATMKPKARWTTQIIILIALGLSLILLVLTRYLWRDRVRSVRRKLVERAMREGRSHA